MEAFLFLISKKKFGCCRKDVNHATSAFDCENNLKKRAFITVYKYLEVVEMM